MKNAPPTDPCTLVACLCAGWCRSCEAYRQVFEQLAQQFPEHRFVWIDIEDESEAVGELDIETFPTLLIGGRAGVQFFGPITPQLATAQRLLTRLAATPPSQVQPEAQALLVRLLPT